MVRNKQAVALTGEVVDDGDEGGEGLSEESSGRGGGVGAMGKLSENGSGESRFADSTPMKSCEQGRGVMCVSG